MPERPPENPGDERRLRHPEAQLGGADAVEKTTYVVGKGTEPEMQRGEEPAALVPSRAPTTLLIVVAVAVVLAAIVFLLAFLAGR